MVRSRSTGPASSLEVSRQCAYFTAVTGRPGDVLEHYSAALGLPVGELADHPHALVGSIESIVDALQRRRDAYGISYVTVPASAMAEFAPVVARLAGS